MVCAVYISSHSIKRFASVEYRKAKTLRYRFSSDLTFVFLFHCFQYPKTYYLKNHLVVNFIHYTSHPIYLSYKRLSLL